MKRLLFFLVLLALSSAAAASVPTGTCKKTGNYAAQFGADRPGYTVDACRSALIAVETAGRNVPESGLGGVYVLGSGTQNRDYYTVNYGQFGMLYGVTMTSCPAGQIENGTATGCVPDPALACASRAGQTVRLTVTVLSNGSIPDAANDSTLGCAVTRSTGADVGVCLYVNPSAPATSAKTCSATYVYTGAAASGGSPNSQTPTTPPPNGQVTPPTINTTGTPTGPGGQTTVETGAIESNVQQGPPHTQTITIHNTTTTNTVESSEPRDGGGTNSTTVVTVTTGGGSTTVLTSPTTGTGQPSVTGSQNGTTTSQSTTKRTTFPDGSKSETCEGPNCPGTPGTTPEEKKDEANKYTGAACDSIPACKGDPIQCAQATNAWRTQCQIKKDNERIFGTAEQNKEALERLMADKIETPAEMEDALGVSTLNFRDYAQFSETLFPVPTGCPADRPVNVMGGTVNVSFGPICQFADVVRPIVVLVAYILAALILYRAIAQKY